MIVMKFGGTSNQDAAAMRNVVRIVKAHITSRPVVVISAIARATNELEQIARSAAAGKEEESVAVLERLLDRHRTIATDLIKQESRRQEIETLLDDVRSRLRRLVQGVAIVQELTPRTMDAICSYGERMSSTLIAAALEEAGVPSSWVDARDFMITNDNFGNAAPSMEIVTERLATRVVPLLGAGRTPVTQGFIGATPAGAYTTMGRESSDFSAAIIGAAMNAELVQIWTDVDGILTADPTIVDRPRVVREMSFEEAFELAWFGAKVLHRKTMLPLLERKIPLEIRNSRNSENRGTRVQSREETSGDPLPLKPITYQKDLMLFSVQPLKRSDRYLFWEGVYSVLARHDLQSDMSVTSEHALAFAVKGVKDPQSVQSELEEFGTVSVSSGMASVSIIGGAVRSHADVVARVFRALAGIPIAMVTIGASALSVTLLVNESRVSESVKLLHAEFFS